METEQHMSHEDTCPDRWTARREGERAQENGYGRWRNPYDDFLRPDRQCEEAADEWRRGYRSAEIREDEAREEEAMRRRAELRRAEEMSWEEYNLANHERDE